MRSTRSVRNRKNRKKTEAVDVDITSLLDILVILLVFLLKSYNSSGVIINIPEGIKLPKSESINLNSHGVNVQVGPTSIWVDDKEVLNTSKMPPRAYDQGGRRIIPLFNELVKKKRLIVEASKRTDKAKKFSGIVNLIVDKSIKYNYIKKIMYTCAEAGHKQFKFVVMGEDF